MIPLTAGEEVLAEWRRDTLLFCADVFDPEDQPREWQVDWLEATEGKKRIALLGTRDAGKSRALAKRIFRFMATRPDATVVIFVPVERVWTAGIGVELRALWSRSRLPQLFPDWVFGANGITTDNPRKRLLAFSTSKPEFAEGVHAENIMLVLDEAKAISDTFFASLRGMLAPPESVLIAAGTAGPPVGWFYRAQNSQAHLWDSRTIIPATMIPRLRRHLARERQAEGNSPFFRQQYLCEFVTVAESGLFDIAMIEKALGADPDGADEIIPGFGGPVRRRVMGIDFAARVDDTAIAFLVGRKFVRFKLLEHGDEMEQVRRIVEEIGKFRPQTVAIDEIGIGGGIASRLSEILAGDPREIRLSRWNAGRAALQNERYQNRKTELQVAARRALIDGKLGLPSRESDPAIVDRLTREMLGVSLVERPDGRSRSVDPADSPDIWDSALCALSVVDEIRAPSAIAFTPAWL